MMAWRVMSIITAVLVLLIVIEMMRRRKLREKYAGIWLFLAIGVVVLGAVPGVMEFMAGILHFQTSCCSWRWAYSAWSRCT
jgi:heme A synthase